MKGFSSLLMLSVVLGCSAELKVDGERAFNHLKTLVSFGPRIPGTPGMEKARGFLRKELESYGLKVEEDRFSVETEKGKVELVNLIATLPGKSKNSILLASHYDTKNIGEPACPGANDGASSSGLLLELSRQLAATKPLSLTLRFVFFDGEESFGHWSPTDGLHGSRHLAETWKARGEIASVHAMILLDMVGDKDLTVYRESISSTWLVEAFRKAAKELGHGSYFFQEQGSYEDDHRPFLKENVPSIDLIDASYGPAHSNGFGAYWHTAEDTADKCSAKSLQIVGDVTLLALRKIEEEITR